MVAFEVMQAGLADISGPGSPEAIAWYSDALSYWVNPRNTVDGKASTLIHVSNSMLTGGYVTTSCKFFAGRENDLTNIDLYAQTVDTSLLFPIDPSNPIFITIKFYANKPYSTHQ